MMRWQPKKRRIRTEWSCRRVASWPMGYIVAGALIYIFYLTQKLYISEEMLRKAELQTEAASKPPNEDEMGNDAAQKRNRELSDENSLEKQQKKTAALQSTEPKVDIAYLVQTGGKDANSLRRLMSAIYTSSNIYLIHIDRTAAAENVDEIKEWTSLQPDNVRLLTPSQGISYRGPSMFTTTLFGIAVLLNWDKSWSHFINLSASDYPLATQEEIVSILKQPDISDKNFMSMKHTKDSRIRNTKIYFDEAYFMQEPMAEVAEIPNKKHRIDLRRRYPDMFQVLKGEAWVILTRDFCTYATLSLDNNARSMVAYFANSASSAEHFFQTVLCRSKEFKSRVVNTAMRWIEWPQPRNLPLRLRHARTAEEMKERTDWYQHPVTIFPHTVVRAFESGDLFARKFVSNSPCYDTVDAYLKDESLKRSRMERIENNIRKAITLGVCEDAPKSNS